MRGRSLMVSDRPSGPVVHPSASEGSMRPSSPVRASPSNDSNWLICRRPIAGLGEETWLHPIRSSAGDPGAEDAERSLQAPVAVAIAAAITMTAVTSLPGQHPPRAWVMNYFLFIGGSSTKLTHIPLGFT